MNINKKKLLLFFASTLVIWGGVLLYEVLTSFENKTFYWILNLFCFVAFFACTILFGLMQISFFKRTESLEGSIGELLINSSVPMVITDKHFDIVEFNHGFKELFSLPDISAITKKHLFELIDLIPKEGHDFSFTIKSDESNWEDFGSALISPSARLNFKIDTTYSKEADTYIFFLRDITRFKAIELKLNDQIYNDYLTKLPNRKAFLRDFEHFKEDYKKMENVSFNAHLAMIDLDKFSSVNSNEGLESGNLVLQDFSSLLKSQLKDEKNIDLYHMGGDEFVLFFRNWDHEVVEECLIELMNVFKYNSQLNDTGYQLSTSIGVVQYPDNGKGVDTLFKHCDVAMGYAKKTIGNSYRFFTQQMADIIAHRSHLLEGMKKSLEKRTGFYLVYQPKIDTSNGAMSSVEVLLRWKHENHNVSPGQFIPIAEESGLATPIFQFVFETAIQELGDLIGNRLESFSINVSATQLSTPDDIHNLISILEKNQTYAKHIVLEITETCIMENIGIALDCLNDIKKMGYRISIDDFGTGYSSLNTMKMLPVEELKIDRSFIQHIPNQKDEAIVKAIIQMAKSFDFKVVAEGVEERDQLMFLEHTDCDAIQGFYFSKPLDIDRLKRFSEDSF